MERKVFSKWRQRLWPVETFELRKVLPLLFMKFFISFNYGILASLKDTFIVTEKGSGAEVIPVLKGWIVLPVAMLATVMFSKLSNIYKRSTLFYGVITTFLLFFALYAFVLYPNKELLSPHATADFLVQKFGSQYAHWIAIFRNWMQALFFVFAELWGGLVIFLLFWGFANQISTLGEAKRYYTLLIAAGDLAAIATGPLVGYYAMKFAKTDYLHTLQSLAGFLILFGIMIMCLHWWMTKYVLNDLRLYDPKKCGREEEKTKLSLWQGIKFIASSKYLRCLAIMVVSYGLAINLVEVSWKASLKLQYPNPSDYQAFYGTITSIVGLVSLLTAFFVGGGVIRFFGWHFSAQLTPVIVGITGLLFLNFLLFKSYLPIPFGLTSLVFIILFGAFQNIISKVTKYTFFDPTKEMAFIPLDRESKVKGKAAIDVVGARLGKSGSAWLQLIFMQIASTSSVLAITHYLVPFVALTVIYWMISIKTLNKLFQQRTSEEEETVQEEAATIETT
jgi:ATP:ADP antiporter, AAA family